MKETKIENSLDEIKNQIKQEVKSEVGNLTRLSFSKVLSFIIPIVIFVATTVWALHKIISPIEQKLALMELRFNEYQSTGLITNGKDFQGKCINIQVKRDGEKLSFNDLDSQLSQISYKLETNPELIAIVIGHSDKLSDMHIAVNESLTWAEEFASKIKKQGISGNRIFTRSLGFQRLLTVPGSELNNRIEVILLNLNSLIVPGDA